MRIEVEASAGGQRHPNTARAAVQLPRTLYLAVGVDTTATGACAQSAFDAAKTNAARPGVYVNIAAARQVRLDIPAAGPGRKWGSHRLGVNAAAAGIHRALRTQVLHPYVTRASMQLHRCANSLHGNLARP